MDFVFLHPDFFWILPPIMVLFFFWMTQKSHEYSWLDERVFQKLYVKEHTLSLKARNALFFAAALLMVIAMAQPILYDPDIKGTRFKILLVLDLHPDRIEASKTLSLEVLQKLHDDDVALATYSSLLAPPSRQYRFLEQLITDAPQEQYWIATDEVVKNFAQLYRFDTIVIPEQKTLLNSSREALEEEAGKIVKEIEHQKEKYSYRYHTPLFPYPLGAAMVLILLALSSKSMRKSVSVEIFMICLLFGNVPSDAALMDFKLLQEANQAYAEGKYHTSLQKFYSYQKEHDSPQIRYNIANVYFRLGEYQEAVAWYEKVRTDDAILMRYRNENLKKALSFIDKRVAPKQTPPQSHHTKSNKCDCTVPKKEKAPIALYPLRIFLN